MLPRKQFGELSKSQKIGELPDTGTEGLVEEKSDENDADGNNNDGTHKEVDNSNLLSKNPAFKIGDKGASQRVAIPLANENCENCCRKCNSNLIFF